jgi:hypothetical protein
MLVASLLAGHRRAPHHHPPTIPLVISWQAQRTMRRIAQQFIRATLEAALPDGWIPSPTRRTST